MKLLIYIYVIFSVVSCSFQHEPMEAINYKAEYYSVVESEDIAPDKEIDSLISLYKLGVDSIMQEIIIVSDKEIYRRKPSGPLDNLICDAMAIELAKVVNVPINIVMYNYYGIRRPLPKGNVTKGNIFEILPFENQATLVHLNPKGMQGLIKYVYKSGGQPLSGIDISYIDSNNYNVLIGGEKYDTSKHYWVATSDYAANGGDNMTFYQDSDSIFYTGVLIRDNLLTYLDSLSQYNIALKADTVQRVHFATNNKL